MTTLERRRSELTDRYPAELVDRAIRTLPRRTKGDATDDRILDPGEVGRPIPLKEATLTSVFRTAMAPKGTPTRVVWHHRGSECVVALNKTRVKVIDGFVIVGISLATAETGAAELTVPFAVGTEQRISGMLAVTERRPRGNPSLARTWGEGVIALAWRTMLEVADVLSALRGTDRDGLPPRAGALVAGEGFLQVVPQARHEYERPEQTRSTKAGLSLTERLGLR